MWNVAEWKSASYSMFSWRSSLLEEIDKALEAYDEIKASRPNDLTLRIYTLDLIIAAIDRWYEKEGKLSDHRRAGIKLYNAAKLEKNLLKSRRIADQKAAEEQKELIASIQGTLSQMMKAPPVTPRIPAAPPMPLTSAQKQDITDALTQARKQLLATKLGQHLLSELTDRRLKLLGVGDVSAELEAADRQLIVDDLPPIQLGYLTAKNLLNVDTGLRNRKEAVKGEAIRILAYMIGNSKDVADAFLNKNFEVVVVPRSKYMTNLAEFSSLSAANTFDGRGWKGTRGAGYVFDTPDGRQPADLAAYMQSKKKIYVAVTEENITGTKFFDVDTKTNLSYDCKYSTTLHEFAHTLDKFALNSSQRSTLDRLYKRKRSDGAGNELIIDNRDATARLYFDGDVASISEILNRQWADGPRLKQAGGAADYTLLNSKGRERWTPVTTTAGSSTKGVTVNLPSPPADCYAGSHRLEYFAQTVCAYFGANTGSDTTTGRPRNNGRAWVQANEPKEMLDLLDELFGHGRYLLDDLNLVERPKGDRWWEK